MFDIIIPGSEIPEWFSQQRDDSSIKIDLPLEVWNDSQWMGVASCCIFVSDDASRVQGLVCTTVIHDRYSRQAKCTQSNFQGRNPREDFIRYFSCDMLYVLSDWLDQECDELELFFERYGSVKVKNDKVKKCGVRKVFKRDLEETQELHSSQCCANFEDIHQHTADDGSIGNGSLIKQKHN
ncbi:hypothetical protein ES332_D11G348800v1 [Gossypium tomentosum]|uniref:C-JID domain-containing protein n=1 Tax=Gossypium tomentosum TaxID=34277 RepID=A0A5D2IW69_GOSTO|nr:hypothetical protein ES332_D11G348800v1 [Gossypium tomentosum]